MWWHLLLRLLSYVADRRRVAWRRVIHRLSVCVLTIRFRATLCAQIAVNIVACAWRARAKALMAAMCAALELDRCVGDVIGVTQHGADAIQYWCAATRR